MSGVLASRRSYGDDADADEPPRPTSSVMLSCASPTRRSVGTEDEDDGPLMAAAPTPTAGPETENERRVEWRAAEVAA